MTATQPSAFSFAAANGRTFWGGWHLHDARAVWSKTWRRARRGPDYLDPSSLLDATAWALLTARQRAALSGQPTRPGAEVRCSKLGCRARGHAPPARTAPTMVRYAGEWFCLEHNPGRPPRRIPQVGERVRAIALNDETSRPELLGQEGTVRRLIGSTEEEALCGETAEDPMIDVELDSGERWQFWQEEIVPLADLDLSSARARLLSVLGQGGLLVSIVAPVPLRAAQAGGAHG